MAPRTRKIGTKWMGGSVVSFRIIRAPCSLNDEGRRIFATIYGTPIKNG